MAYTYENKRDEPYMDGPVSSATATLLRVVGKDDMSCYVDVAS